MARAGFYNENEYRDYPFLTQVEPLAVVATLENSSSSSASSNSSASAQPYLDLPHETIVDFGAIMGVDSGFVTADDFVWLHRIRRKGDYLLFEFRTTAEDAELESLYFTRLITDAEFKYEWSESRSRFLPDPFPDDSLSSSSVSSSLSSVSVYESPFCTPGSDDGTGLHCGGPGCTTPKWEGYLITGLFAELADGLSDGEQIIFTRGVWVIEPARLQNLNNSYARSINLANFDRTHVTPPEVCSSVSLGEVEVYVNALCLQGDIEFKEGYNCNIRQEAQTNSLVISGTVGGGEGIPCEEIELFPGELPPGDSPFLTGGPACGDTIRTISGKGGADIRIYGGAGVRVFDAPTDPSAIFVDTDLADFAICLQNEPQPGDPCYESSSSAGGA